MVNNADSIPPSLSQTHRDQNVAPLHGLALKEKPTVQTSSRLGKQNDCISPLFLVEQQGPKPSHGEILPFVTVFKRTWVCIGRARIWRFLPHHKLVNLTLACCSLVIIPHTWGVRVFLKSPRKHKLYVKPKQVTKAREKKLATRHVSTAWISSYLSSQKSGTLSCLEGFTGRDGLQPCYVDTGRSCRAYSLHPITWEQLRSDHHSLQMRDLPCSQRGLSKADPGLLLRINAPHDRGSAACSHHQISSTSRLLVPP